MQSDELSTDGIRPISAEEGSVSEPHVQTPMETPAPRPRFGLFGRLEQLIKKFSSGEKIILYILTVILTCSALVLLVGVNEAVSITVPARGGSLTEGSVGTPRFLNPLLAISQVDQDMTALIYSGLTRTMPDGTVVSDLAETYQVSDDGATYTFHIRPNATFSDGTKVTADDVMYTVQLAQNPDIKSPRRSDWEGVSVKSTDERTVVFTLPHAYAPFLENTSLGILPKHLWVSVSVEEFPFSNLNTRPIGSGPFQIQGVKSDSTGAPLSYTLAPFDNFSLGAAHLKKLTFRFFPNEQTLLDAFDNGDVDSFAGVSPEHVSKGNRSDAEIKKAPSTRIFAVFFNQNHAPIFVDTSVRAALTASIDRNQLINSVLSGYGAPVGGPLPPGLLVQKQASTTEVVSPEDRIAKAQATLTRGGWKFDDTEKRWKKGKQTLTFALATADTPELLKTAHAIEDTWKKIGVDVTVQVYPLSELNTTIIRPRAYDAILFGEVVGRTLDLFAFWHSSQRNDPGLNLALYANAKADKILTIARAQANRKERESSYRQFADLIAADQPAVFLYAPEFIYVVPAALHGVTLGTLTTPSERFLTINQWYTETERVWSIFTQHLDQ